MGAGLAGGRGDRTSQAGGKEGLREDEVSLAGVLPGRATGALDDRGREFGLALVQAFGRREVRRLPRKSAII